MISFISVISVNTNFDGAQPQVRVGGRPLTSGVEDNFERSTSVSRFEAFAGTQEAGSSEPENREGQLVQSCVVCPRSGAREGCEARICYEDCGRGRRNVPHFDGSTEESSVPGSGTTHPRQNCSHEIFLGEIRETRGGCASGRWQGQEELAKAEALLEKEEAMFKDGHQRLR